MSENRVILLVGPTGVGKTSTAIELARWLGTEIISADSMQVYRHMDIGTEKPTPEERAAVTHHMIDVAEPSEDFSAGRYIERVTPIIERLHKEGRIPLIVGGTGLYVKSMTRGIFEAPEADIALRKRLLSEAGEDHTALHARLRELDPETAAAIAPADTRRLLRALEVCMLTGRPISELRSEGTRPLPYEFLKLALTRDRAELYSMIERRVEAMMTRGLVAEVERVLAMQPGRTAMQAIGYKEVARMLAGELTMQEAVELIKRSSRRYAKRQYTWFNNQEDLLWVDITGVTDPKAAADRVREALAPCLHI